MERDKLLINEAKEEAIFRKEMTKKVIKVSNLTFMRAMETFGTSMTAVAQSLSRSVENMTS